MRHRVHTGGSDGILQGFKPHPRAYGTFPQYLGTLRTGVGRPVAGGDASPTSPRRPAARLRLPDRGLVREGYRADLVLFDPETVAAGSTFEAPRTLPDRHPARPDRRAVRDAGRPADGRAGGAGGRRSPASTAARLSPSGVSGHLFQPAAALREGAGWGKSPAPPRTAVRKPTAPHNPTFHLLPDARTMR